MLRSAVVLSLSALVLGRATGDLTVKLTAVSSSVPSVDDVVVTAVVSNPTTEDIKVLKFGTVLDELPTNSFAVKKGDADVLFTGIEVVPDLTDDAAYVTIPAGGSLAVNHTVAALYDFATSGAGTYTFSTPSNFQVFDGSESSSLLAIPESSVDIEITDDLARREIYPGHLEARAPALSTPSCADATRKNFIAAALTEARALAGGAAADIKSHPNSAPYKSYFSDNNRNDVWYNFDRIAGDLASSGKRSLFCKDRAGGSCGSGGVVAYTLVVTSGGSIVGSDIYFCNNFFGMRPTKDICSGAAFSSTRGNVMIHELTHAVFGSKDTVYGCDGSKGLSQAQKKMNADNYACFSQQIKKNYNC